MKHKSRFTGFSSLVLVPLAGFFIILLFAPVEGRATEPKPNIIYIMADDMGYGDLGCYGQQYIQTPQIDQLAVGGMRFTQCYAGSSVCAPSRCSLMTGMHVGHCTVRDNFSAFGLRIPLLPEDVTVGEVLQDAGYYTGIIGKWGLGEPGTTGIPNSQGFDYFFGYLNQANAHNYFPAYLWRNQTQILYNGTEYSHDLFTVEAKQFINDRQGEPFFLYLAYTVPHAQLVVPDDDVTPYTNEPWTWDEKVCAAMITRMDTDVGEIMALLQQLGLDNDTIVFFCSDNGGAHTSFRFNTNGPLRSKKGDMYEGGIRVPMIVRWPNKIQAGAVSDYAWAFQDFLPTAADIADAPMPGGLNLDGTSILPELLGQPQVDHPFLYWEQASNRIEQGLLIGDWKAVKPGLSNPVELYNLAIDIDESNNLASVYPNVLGRMKHAMTTTRIYNPDYPVQLPVEPCAVFGTLDNIELLSYAGDSPGCADLTHAELDVERIYSDRYCTLKDVPIDYQGGVLVQLGNDDKDFTGNNLLEFWMHIDGTVVVGYDSRAANVPSWLNDWQATGHIITATGFPQDVDFNVYTKSYLYNQVVTLPGNHVGGGDGPDGYIVIVELGEPPVPGDFDNDEDVDQEDFGRFQACLGKERSPQNDPDCFPALMDDDTDVDRQDFLIFMACMSGPNIPATPGCAGS